MLRLSKKTIEFSHVLQRNVAAANPSSHDVLQRNVTAAKRTYDVSRGQNRYVRLL